MCKSVPSDSVQQERLKRMKGEDLEEQDSKRPKFQSADALEDDFVPDDRFKTFGPVQEEEEEEEDEEEEEEEREVIIKRKSQSDGQNDTNDIPYTFDMPDSYEDFLELLENRNLEQQKTIIHRIRVCNQVGQGNRAKMEVCAFVLPLTFQQFFQILLQYFQQLSGEFPINFDYLNYITKFMYEAAKMSSQHATKVMQKTVKSMMKSLQTEGTFSVIYVSLDR